MNVINPNALNHRFETDILVIGAGSAGCVAAIGSSFGKYSVTLVERYGFPGGTSTQMLDTFYGFFTPGEIPKKIVGGIPDQVVNRLDKSGDIFLRPNTYGAGTGVNYNPERLKLVWDTLLQERDIKVLYHSLLIDVNVKPESSECIFFAKGTGFFSITAKRVIDASGDADYCHLAGIPYEKAGEKEPAQSMTTTFRMANVDLKKFDAAGGKKFLNERMKWVVETGKYLLPRKEGSAHEMCQPLCISTVAVKVIDKDALDVEQLTLAEIEGRNQSFTYEDFFRSEIAGYENSKIIGLSTQIGVRETRRVYGLGRLTKEDFMKESMPGDRIFLCGAPIDDHRKGSTGESETFWQYVPGSGVYGVSYKTIVPQRSNHSWMVGRCFSATHDAHASCRSMAQTMSMGQAAGFAAVLSLDTDISSAEVDIDRLQRILTDTGAVLDAPAERAFTGREEWKRNVK